MRATPICLRAVRGPKIRRPIEALGAGMLTSKRLRAFSGGWFHPGAWLSCTLTSVESVGDLPKTFTGKIRKNELRSPEWEGRGARIY